jgi:hypothetical protein
MMKTLIHTQQLNAIYQSLSILNVTELDQVMQEVLILRRKKLPTVLTQNETELLKKINTGAPSVIQKRNNFLVKKRNKETLNEEEYQELLELTAYMENLGVKRLENLLELAKLRNLSLDEIIEQLQLKPRLYVA